MVLMTFLLTDWKRKQQLNDRNGWQFVSRSVFAGGRCPPAKKRMSSTLALTNLYCCCIIELIIAEKHDGQAFRQNENKK